MAIHKTETGWVELMDRWGHGRGELKNWGRAPCVITADDGDGHYEAWRYHGTLRDAAKAVAWFLSRNNGDHMLAVLGGSHITLVRRPDWAEGVEEITADDDVIYHPEKHPGGLMVV